ncbi:MAG: hypothetical protein JST80_13695 [Bdellovibrionales bacterium]|nr:hypothetical protein [Bdellovibrionales bacterium]
MLTQPRKIDIFIYDAIRYKFDRIFAIESMTRAKFLFKWAFVFKLIGAFFCLSQCWAESYCSSLLMEVRRQIDVRQETVPHPEIKIQPFDSSPPPTELHTSVVLKTIYEIDGILATHLRVPKKLRIQIRPVGDAGLMREDGLGTLLQVTFQSRTPGGKSKHPKFSTAITAHEYGHAILRENLRENVPWMDMYSRYQVTLSANQKKITELARTLNGSDTPQNRKNIPIQIESLENQIEEIEEKLFTLQEKTAPFDELFADLIAVLHSGDARSIRNMNHVGELQDIEKGLRSRSGKIRPIFQKIYQQAKLNPAMRDFSEIHSVKGWDETYPYFMFAPVRSFLWREVISQSKFARNPGLVAEKVAKAIGTEMNALRVLSEAEMASISVERRNLRLIEEIKNELGLNISP